MSERRREEGVMKALPARRSRCREESGRQIGRPGRARRMAALNVSAPRANGVLPGTAEGRSLWGVRSSRGGGGGSVGVDDCLGRGRGRAFEAADGAVAGGRTGRNNTARFVGRRSMLRHTLERAERLGGAERMVVVVAKHHEPHVWSAWTSVTWRQLSRSRGTAGRRPGLSAADLHRRERWWSDGGDPAVGPFRAPGGGLLAAIRRAVRAVRCLPGSCYAGRAAGYGGDGIWLGQ